MRNIIKILIVTLLLFQRPVHAYAWGKQGHRIVCEMAYWLLNDAARKKVDSIFNGYPIDNAAVWMDSVRINKVPGWGYMTPWHFLDMDAGQTYADVASDADVVFELDKVMRELQHPENIDPDSLGIKLRVVFHLMGDIAQPLHVGYAKDRGGNDVRVKSPIPHGSNELHAVWDDDIIVRGKINLKSSQAYYQKLNQDQINGIIAGSTQDWMNQSRSYITPIYAFPHTGPGVHPLTLQYLDTNVPVVQQQLVYAAVRLANTLNAAFGS